MTLCYLIFTGNQDQYHGVFFFYVFKDQMIVFVTMGWIGHKCATPTYLTAVWNNCWMSVKEGRIGFFLYLASIFSSCPVTSTDHVCCDVSIKGLAAVTPCSRNNGHRDSPQGEGGLASTHTVVAPPRHPTHQALDHSGPLPGQRRQRHIFVQHHGGTQLDRKAKKKKNPSTPSVKKGSVATNQHKIIIKPCSPSCLDRAINSIFCAIVVVIQPTSSALIIPASIRSKTSLINPLCSTSPATHSRHTRSATSKTANAALSAGCFNRQSFANTTMTLGENEPVLCIVCAQVTKNNNNAALNFRGNPNKDTVLYWYRKTNIANDFFVEHKIYLTCILIHCFSFWVMKNKRCFLLWPQLVIKLESFR